MEFTIIEPGFEFIPPPEVDRYLEFLELCTRTCYKSEDCIVPGSAERLMTKVVKEYEHLSVTEHANLIVRFNHITNVAHLISTLIQLNPLFASRISVLPSENNTWPIIISGNVRMWMELFKKAHCRSEFIWGHLESVMHNAIPLLFEKIVNSSAYGMRLLDSNPLTNEDNLSPEQMEKHMTLTCRLIGDRSMSHQLVRHRMAAYSQESQRYCNYGKKGGQYIIPPSIANTSEAVRFAWEEQVRCNFKLYEGLLNEGIPPEDARSLLPNCTKTEVVTTYTLGMWKHVFEHRAHNPKAQWQIRQIMQGIEAKFRDLLPEVFYDVGLAKSTI